jgi:hypothetical protein
MGDVLLKELNSVIHTVDVRGSPDNRLDLAQGKSQHTLAVFLEIGLFDTLLDPAGFRRRCGPGGAPRACRLARAAARPHVRNIAGLNLSGAPAAERDVHSRLKKRRCAQ